MLPGMPAFSPLLLALSGCLLPVDTATSTPVEVIDSGDPMDSVPVDTQEPYVEIDSVGDQDDQTRP